MSGKSVLFLAFAAVILVLAVGQGLLLNYLSDDIQREIRSQSLHLSKEIALFATDSLELSQANIKIEPNNPNSQHSEMAEAEQQVLKKVIKKLESDEAQVFVYQQDEAEFEFKSDSPGVPSSSNQQPKSLMTFVQQQLDKIEVHRLEHSTNDQQVWIFESSTNGAPPMRKTINIQDSTGALLDKLKQQALWVLLSGTMLGLLLAYWISYKFNKPLRKLSQGYQQVSQGNFNAQLQPEGVAEMRQAIHGFNQMAVKLGELKAKEHQLQEKSHLAEIGEVSRGIAHALRNPLHTIGLALDRLLPGKPDQADLELGIRKKLKHMDKTIQSLLTLTSTGVDRQQQVPLKSLLRDIILEIKMAESKSVQFDYDFDADIKLIGAESELRSILHTLLINAVDASSEQQTITIQALKQDNRLDIHVVDQGAGISDAVKQKLFQPHVTTKAEGTGMGLYIAKRLAQLFYQGDIQIENQTPQGCKATFSINRTLTHE